MRLTDAIVRKLEVSQQTDIADEICRGLKLRITRDGTKTWVLVAWNAPTKKTVRTTLGRFPTITTAQARKLADATRETVTTAEPEIETEPQPVAAVYTFNNLADDYIEIYAKRQKKSWEQDIKWLKDPRRAWGTRPANSITRRDIVTLLDGIAARAPVSSNRVKATLSKMFNWSSGRDLIDSNPMTGWREAPGGREKPKDRVLSDDEVRAVWNGLGWSISECAARAILLTGQRPGEVASAMIEEIDLDRALWTISAEKAKNSRAHAVPLTPQAVALFRKMIGERTVGPVFVGQGDGALGRDAVTRNAHVDGVADYTAHDLRRTAATGARRMGASVSDIGSLLNHTEKGITAQVYALSDRMPEKMRARDALKKWLDQVLKT